MTYCSLISINVHHHQHSDIWTKNVLFARFLASSHPTPGSQKRQATDLPYSIPKGFRPLKASATLREGLKFDDTFSNFTSPR